MTIFEWLEKTVRKLSDTNIQSARLDAELILAQILNKSREWVLAHSDFELNDKILSQAQKDIERRANYEPLAYILGVKEFYGRKFIITPDILIPRPETEQIIDVIKKITKKDPTIKKVIDIGTGSGVIAITLALELPNVEIRATDISIKALRVAQQNKRRFGAKVKFTFANLFSLPQFRKYHTPTPLPRYNIIVANLPYVDRKWDWLDHKSLRFEPRKALFARDRGLRLIKKLIKQAPDHLYSGGYLILEMDPCQIESIKQFAAQYNFVTYAEDSFILTLQKIGEPNQI